MLADHGIKDIVHVLDVLVLQGHVIAIDHGDHHGLQHIGQAHQQVGHHQVQRQKDMGECGPWLPPPAGFQQTDQAEHQEDLELVKICSQELLLLLLLFWWLEWGVPGSPEPLGSLG